MDTIRSFKARKLEELTDDESISSFTSWKQNINFHLASCDQFARFIGPNVTWKPLSVPNRGLVDDTAGNDQKSGEQKAFILEHMIGLIVGYCPQTIRYEIERKCTSLKWIFNRVRRHYGFNKSEVNFLKLATISRKEGERYEAFFQRIMAHLYDNLLSPDSQLLYDGELYTQSEDMSPSTERLAVFLWLHYIDERLPMYISRVYSNDLQKLTLKDLQPTLSQNMDSLLAELAAQEDIRLSYSNSSGNSSFNNNRQRSFNRGSNKKSFYRKSGSSLKSCAFCKTCKKPHLGHDVSNCWSLARFNKSDIVSALTVDVDENEDEEEDCIEDSFANLSVGNIIHSPLAHQPPMANISRVEIMKSPSFVCTYKNTPCKITVDTGATSNIISLRTVKACGMKLVNTSQGARQLDGSQVKTCGEIDVVMNFGVRRLRLVALVVESADADILGGVPFCKKNNIEISLSKEEIYIGDLTVKYGQGPQPFQSRVFKADSFLLRSPTAKVLYPGEKMDLACPDQYGCDGEVAVEPRCDSPSAGQWPTPSFLKVVNGTVEIPNNTNNPIVVSKNQHIANIRSIETVDIHSHDCTEKMLLFDSHNQNLKSASLAVLPARSTCTDLSFCQAVSIDPDGQLTVDQKADFLEVNERYSSVFNPNFTGYNDASGAVRAHVTVGSVPPPPKKARTPFYNQKNLVLLQEKADELERKGVLVPPETIGVVPLHVSPSFLVKKSNGDWRFVTAFNDLSAFCRLPPSKASKINDVLQKIGSYKYIIKTDLTSSFFQIKMSESSIPYLGTLTPFKGVRVYARAAMGMPGSSEYLDELMSRVVGEMLMDETVLKIADDLYVVGSTLSELLSNWERLLATLQRNNLNLSASKTVIAPKSTTILGWIWKCGSLSVSSHKICPLLSSAPPLTCTAMRSFLGAYKDIARAIPRCTSLLAPLEDAIKGLTGEQKISWTDDLNNFFAKAKAALKSPSVLVLPKRSDQLVITTDASPLNQGLAATLFVLKEKNQYPAEFFSFKLKGHQVGWIPCEKEALAITAAVNHFGPFIKESTLKTIVRTDSRPCVQAMEKLKRGLFSASARVSTFLSTLSAFNISLCHIAGSLNAISDYGSRNPQDCMEPNCQICRFVNETADSSVFNLSVSDVLERKAKMPYMSPGAWRSAQQSDPTMRKAFAHLTAGTRPPTKAKHATELRHILRLASVDEKKGILIVQKEDPFVGQRNLIFCPSGIAHGLVTALHLNLSHPTRSQLGKVFNRYFYALSSAKVIDDVTNSCNTCLALKRAPNELFEQSSSSPPSHPGSCLAADVICRAGQKILVVRDTLTSFTAATFIQNETASEYRDAIMLCTLPMKSEVSKVRVDCAPGLKALESDIGLKSAGIKLDFGQAKNKNKNPVAEKANQELEIEILKLDPSGKPISAITLTKAVCVLNSHIPAGFMVTLQSP